MTPTADWSLLLQAIGNPVSADRVTCLEESRELYDLAHRNRVALLYLNALRNRGLLHSLLPEMERLSRRNDKVIQDSTRVGVQLRTNGIQYALVKTLRPYPASPNDIDILYLGTKRELAGVIELLQALGYSKSKEQPWQIGFWDPRRDPSHPRSGDEIDYVDVDLYKSITVKGFTYLDKERIRSYVVEQQGLPGQLVQVLSPPVDLAFLLFHSVFPNRHYSLEMFFTTLYYMRSFADRDCAMFIEFVQQNRISRAINASLSLTSALYQAMWGELPSNMKRLAKALKVPQITADWLPSSFPFLYPQSLFLVVGLSRLADRRLSLHFLGTLVRMLNPAFSFQVCREVWSRKEAETRYKVNY